MVLRLVGLHAALRPHAYRRGPGRLTVSGAGVRPVTA